MKIPFLEGERVYLRPVEAASDLERCLGWINDPEIQSRLGRRLPISRSMEESWFEAQYKKDEGFSLAIVLREGDRHIGNCGLHDLDTVNRSAEFGILIGERDAWGRGYGPEAARLLLQFGFDELGLHRIWLRAYSFNRQAVRAYEKAGFTHEGILRGTYYRHGAFHDSIVMSVLEEEWRA